MNKKMKKLFYFLFYLLMIDIMIMNVSAYVPVTYSCCINYTGEDGTQLDNFENVSLGGTQLDNFENVSLGGTQLDNFENLSNWIVGGIGALQQADTINFEEGSQGLELFAKSGKMAYSESVINKTFINTNNFAIWLYVYDITTFDGAKIDITSTGTAWSKKFSKSVWSPGFKTGWNKLIFIKSDFTNDGGESWNNVMNRVRITIFPKTGQNTNATVDDFRYDVNNDWIVGGTGGVAYQTADTINFMEGLQGLKLVATNGNSFYIDKVINRSFLTTNNFAIWVYINNLTTFDSIRLSFTSSGQNWTSSYYKSIYDFKLGWNKLIFIKNDFTNSGAESWNNVMNRVRITIFPKTGQNTNATVDDFRYDVNNDWIVGGTGAFQQGDTINFKEGRQGIKLTATNGNSAYIDKVINQSFLNTNNFVIWVYVNDSNKTDYIRIYLTSTGSTFDTYFYDSVYSGFVTGWNKLIFNKNSFKNVGGESWNNIMNRIRLRIGPLTTNDVSVTFDDLRRDISGKRAKLMIEFDDGEENTFSNAYPIMKANNQSGVSLVITSWVGSTDYMNITELKTLQSSGWDISSHTVNHANLKTSNDTEQTSEINDSYDWLIINNFQKSAGFIAYPYGAFNDAVIDKVEKRYILGRSTQPESAQPHLAEMDTIRYIQRTINVENKTTIQNITDQLNDTINANLLGILLFHGIVDSNPDQYDYLKTDFQNISNYIKNRSNDIDVITYSDYVIPNINAFTPVINKTTRINSNGTAILVINNKYDEYMPNMSVIPSSDFVDINVTRFDELGGSIKFNESTNNSIKVSYSIGNRIPNQLYNIKIYWSNGTKFQDFNISANNTGYINYDSVAFSDRYYEINVGGVTDTSFTVTLPVGYTNILFNSSMSTIKNLDPNGQNTTQPIIKITNSGNIIQNFGFYLNGTVNNITTYADIDNNHSDGRIEINSTGANVVSNLNPGFSQNVWLIIDSKNAPSMNINKTLMINSSN